MGNFVTAYDALRHVAQVSFLAAAALLPIVNPLGSAAMYLRLTAKVAPNARDRLARLVVFDAFLLLLGATLLGAYVLDFFGISVPAVQLAGGIVVCTIAWPLLVGPDQAEETSQTEGSEFLAEWRPRAFYPLAMPITVGPGSLSVALALGANPSRDLRTEAITVLGHVLGILVVSLAVYVCYRYGERILGKLGPTGVTVLSRLLAFILLCIGVQIAWNGVHGFLNEAFPAVHAEATSLSSHLCAQTSSNPKPSKLHELDITHATEDQFSGDFDQMLERRRIRVLVPYSRTLFFHDKGAQRGMTAHLVLEFEQYLNRKYAKRLKKRPLTLYIIPTTRDELIDDVARGVGDIAAGDLSVTDDRLKKVDFAYLPDVAGVNQVIVTGPTSPTVTNINDLAGKTIHSRPASSHFQTLLELNKRFSAEGKAQMRVVPLPDALEDEDRLEMLNAGLVELLAIDDWKAKAWAQVLPKIRVREDLTLKRDVKIGWAIRKASPQLEGEIEAFMAKANKVTRLEARRELAASQVRRMHNSESGADYKRFEATIALFKKYGARYGFDPIMLAAQGYQESRLRQDARSSVGAIGVMQLMPATGSALRVGDITQLEPNIHAGTKYMGQLMATYFPDAKFSDFDRPLFAFASYNAGPGRMARLRKEAEKRGLDPDKWFNNVEILAAEKVGIELTSYVRNIFKYYVAYTLTEEVQLERQNARKSLGPPKVGNPNT
jgi:MarC family membrane protein